MPITHPLLGYFWVKYAKWAHMNDSTRDMHPWIPKEKTLGEVLTWSVRSLEQTPSHLTTLSKHLSTKQGLTVEPLFG